MMPSNAPAQPPRERVIDVGFALGRYGGYGGWSGPLVQLIFGAVTVGAYWFNPGPGDQVVVGSIGAKF